MKNRNFLFLIILSLSMAAIFSGCGSSGDGDFTGNGKILRAMALQNDLLISHSTVSATDPQPGDQNQPSVAYDTVTSVTGTGAYLVVWTDYRSVSSDCSGTACGTDIYGAICTGTGVGVTTNMTCSNSFAIAHAAGNQTQPKVAFYPNTASPLNSKYFVVWTDSRSGSYSQIYGQFVSAVTGSLLGNNFPISDYTASVNINQYDPDLIFNPVLNKFIVAWIDVTTVDTEYNHTIAYISREGGGAWSLSDSLLIPTPETAIYSIKKSNGSALTGYSLSRSVGSQITVVTLIGGSNAIGDSNPLIVEYNKNQMVVRGTGCANEWIYGHIPVPKSDNYLVRTIEVDPSGTKSNLQQISEQVSAAPIVDVSAASPPYFMTSWYVQFNEQKPKISFSGVTGDYFVAWSGMNHWVDFKAEYTGDALNSRFISAPTNSVNWLEGDTFELGVPYTNNIIDATFSTSNPAIAGTKLLVSYGTPTVLVTVGAGSDVIGTSVNIIADVIYDRGSRCSYRNAVFTTDTEKSDALKKVKLRKDTGLGIVQDFSFGTEATSPALAADPNTNRLLVAWEENDGGLVTGKNIYGQLLDFANFVNYGNTILISGTSSIAGSAPAVGDQTSPVAAFDNVNQRFMVAWEDARNQSANISNVDIYAQFVDPQGNLSGGNAIVTVQPGNQLSPAVSFGDVNYRKFLVTFADGRDSSQSDIYGQLLEYSTSPQLVITDANNIPITNGAIDFGNIASGGTGTAQIIKLRNDGNSQLTISSMTDPDQPFSFTTPKPVTISPGTSYPMTVLFAPLGAGSFAGNASNNFKTTITSDGGTAVLYFSGNGVGINPLAVTTATLPDVRMGGTYHNTLSASGGVFPYSWSLSGGALPAGITLNASTGVLSTATGTTVTAAAATYSFTVTVSDNNTPPTTATRDLTIKVINPSALQVTTTTLVPWTAGVAYPSTTLTATGGTAPRTWPGNPTAGSLPTGLTIDAAGLLSGTTSSNISGVFNFTVRVTDNVLATATKDLSLTINPRPVILTTSLPSGAVLAPYSTTLAMSGGTAPMTWSLGSGNLPAGLTLNASSGVISGSPTGAGSTAITVRVTDATGASFETLTLTIDVNAALDITTPTSGVGSPTYATVGTPYSFTFAGSGGSAPYTWSIPALGGSLPDGVTLNVFTGKISGTPSAAGTYQFNIQIQDTAGTKITKLYTIKAYNPVAITTSSLLPWTAGTTSYSQSLIATGGTGTYTWIITSGSLPTGLSLNASTGAITGTPSTAGSYPITFKASDTNSPAIYASASITITINAPLQITTSSLANSVQGSVYSQQLLATGGTTPLVWTLSSGSLPAGLSMSTLGVISGVTSTTAASSTFTVRLTDAASATTTQSLTITVDTLPSPISIATNTISAMKTNIAVSSILTATGGSLPYAWAITGGTLPTGLSLTPGGGNLTGTPNVAGNYSFVVQVTDNSGKTASKLYSVAVRDTLAISTTSLKSWDAGQAGYSETLTGGGGVASYAWSNTGSLPTGLTLNASTGVISGTPTTQGTYTFSITLTDSDIPQQTATKQLAIIITVPMVIGTSPSPVPGMMVGLATSFTMSASGGTDPKHWTSTTLPAGLSLDANSGMVSGTPTTAGNTTVIFTVTDNAGKTSSMTMGLTIFPSINVLTTTLPSWTKNVPYSQAILATGGSGSYVTWTKTGTLPPGLTLGAATGVLSGTPTAAGGPYTFTVTVTDSNGKSATSLTYSIVINAPLVITTGSLPYGTIGSLYSQPAMAYFGGTAPVYWITTGGTLPTGLYMDYTTGSIVGVPTSAGVYTFNALATDATATTSLSQTLSISIASAVTITTNGLLPTATAGTSYSYQLGATGGRAPYVWSAVGLPTGLGVSAITGWITGTPQTAAYTTFTVHVTDADGRTDSANLDINVNPQLSIATSSFPAGEVSSAYNQTPQATGGSGSYSSWAITSGAIPSGLSLNGGTGAITGTPTVAGIYTFTLQVTDSAASTASKSFTITINSKLTINTTSLPAGVVANTYPAQSVLISGGIGPYIWTITAGTLPAGLVQGSDGSISGIPTTAGVSNFTVQVTDSLGIQDTQDLSITVTLVPAPLSITTAAALPNGSLGTSYSQVLAGTGGILPYVWSLDPASTLPPGLALGSNGALTGTPTTAGTYNFILTLTDSASPTPTSVSQSFSMIITSGGGSGAGGSGGGDTGGGGGGGCFIATAAYGSYLDPQVMVLRKFRDNYLLTNEIGTAFVRFYYKNSPPIADFIREHEVLRTVTRWMLTPLILAVKYPVMLMLIAGILMAAWMARSGKRKNQAIIAGLLLMLMVLPACSGPCPSPATAKTSLQSIMPANFEIRDVQSVKGISQLCEVSIVMNKQPMVLYLDKKGKYVFSGSVVELDGKKNLTMEAQKGIKL